MNVFTKSQAMPKPLIGIIMLDCSFLRIPGDIGNAMTFNFPVLYEIVKGVSFQKAVKDLEGKYLQPFILAALELEKKGVKAITTSCGFLSSFQQIISKVVKVPFFSSSLIQVPLVYEIIGKKGKIGIITSDSRLLNENHFISVGWSSKNIPIAIASLHECEEFNRVILEDQELKTINTSKIEAEVVSVVKALLDEEQEIRALVIECTNIPPYALSIQRETGLPIFDIITLTNMVYEATGRTSFAL